MGIDSMVWKAAAAAASVPGPTTATTPGTTTGRQDLAGDQRRFEEVLGRPSLQAGVPAESVARDQAIAPVQPIVPADMASATGSMDTLGDEILRSVEQAHGAYEQNLSQINQDVGKSSADPMPIGRLMQLQFDVIKFGINQDLTTKIADKASQGIETVLKDQS
jgi:type III secretion system YscI/HrpB-like protein